MNITAKVRQSLLDLAVQHCGALSVLVALATDNDLSITDELAVGETILAPGIIDTKTAGLFVNLLTKPATALSHDEEDMIREVGDNTADFGTFDLTFDEIFNHYSLI